MRIVVKHDPARRGFIGECLESLGNNDVTVVQTRSFELGAIQYAKEERYSRFLFLQDSCRVLHDDFWNQINKYDSCLVIPRPNCYLAVYLLEVLDEMDIPVVPRDDKEAAIHYETEFCDGYARMYSQIKGSPLPVVYPELTDARAIQNNSYTQINNENRLTLINDHFMKLKGTWRP